MSTRNASAAAERETNQQHNRDVNDVMARRRLDIEAAGGFAAPIEPTNIHSEAASRLALTLSKEFHTLKVTVAFVGGTCSVYAAPRWEPLDLNAGERDREAVSQPTYWPSRERVQSFARGFTTGVQRVGELEEKIVDLKRKVERLEDGGPAFAFHPFFGPMPMPRGRW